MQDAPRQANIQKHDYLDFEIEIGPGDGAKYPVDVLRAPAGEAHSELCLPFSELQLRTYLASFQEILRLNPANRRLISPSEPSVQTFGRTLFEQLFNNEIRSRYDVSQNMAEEQGKGLRIKLRIQSPKLSSLPWEFMYDLRQGEYLCLAKNTPLVRYVELPQPIRPLNTPTPLRILGMIEK